MDLSGKLKKKLRDNQVTFGSWITLFHPSLAEIYGKAGLDWVTIDLEHSTISLAEAEILIRNIEACGSSPIVRLTTNSKDQLKRVMDSGAHGVVAPNIDSVEDVEKIAETLFYPPQGNRGVGLTRAHTFGANFENYLEWGAKNPSLIVMIETAEALGNIESILSYELVDAFVIGPYDLSTSLGIPGDFENPKLKSALDKILETGTRFDKPGGVHIIEPDSSAISSRISQGFKFIPFSLDIRILDSCLREAVGTFKKLQEL